MGYNAKSQRYRYKRSAHKNSLDSTDEISTEITAQKEACHRPTSRATPFIQGESEQDIPSDSMKSKTLTSRRLSQRTLKLIGDIRRKVSDPKKKDTTKTPSPSRTNTPDKDTPEETHRPSYSEFLTPDEQLILDKYVL